MRSETDQIDYMEIAKAITRQHFPTMAEEQYRDGYKPRCLDCLAPCHPRSHEYRTRHLCPSCYVDRLHLPILTVKKEPRL